MDVLSDGLLTLSLGFTFHMYISFSPAGPALTFCAEAIDLTLNVTHMKNNFLGLHELKK